MAVSVNCITHGATCAFQFGDCRLEHALLPGQACTWQPAVGWKLGTPCPVCGHSDLVHIGTKHCPVCELAYQSTPMFRRQQERRHGRPTRIT